MNKLYKLIGLVLLLFGSVFSFLFYFGIHSIPLIGICISILIIGLTSILLGNVEEKIYHKLSPNIYDHHDEDKGKLLKDLGDNNIRIILSSLAITFGIADIILIIFGIDKLEIYFAVNVSIYYLILTLNSNIKKKLKTTLNRLGIFLFTIFIFGLITFLFFHRMV